MRSERGKDKYYACHIRHISTKLKNGVKNEMNGQERIQLNLPGFSSEVLPQRDNRNRSGMQNPGQTQARSEERGKVLIQAFVIQVGLFGQRKFSRVHIDTNTNLLLRFPSKRLSCKVRLEQDEDIPF